MEGNGGEGGRLEVLLRRDECLERDAGARAPSVLGDNLFQLCMRGAIVLGSCYAAFVAYLAMVCTKTWSEKLRLLPLWIFALTIPLLGALMIRKKNHVELQP